jgi:hypothetical protein
MDIETGPIINDPSNAEAKFFQYGAIAAPAVGSVFATLLDQYLASEETLMETPAGQPNSRKRPLPEEDSISETTTTTTTITEQPEPKKARRSITSRRRRSNVPIKKTLITAIRQKLAECKADQKILERDLRSLISRKSKIARSKKAKRSTKNAKKKKRTK